MSPAEHYAEAEEYLQVANDADTDLAVYFLAKAQVHATLALYKPSLVVNNLTEQVR